MHGEPKEIVDDSLYEREHVEVNELREQALNEVGLTELTSGERNPEFKDGENFIDIALREANDYLRLHVLPVLQKLEQKIQAKSDEVNSKIAAGEQLTREELEILEAEVGTEVGKELGPILYGEKIQTNDFLIKYLLMQRVHSLKDLFNKPLEGFNEKYKEYLNYLEDKETYEHYKMPIPSLPYFTPGKLEWDKIEFTKEDIKKKPRDIKDLIKDVVYEFNHNISDIRGNKKIKANVNNLTEQGKIKVAYHNILMYETFKELLRNAADAIPDEGSVVVEISEQGNNVVIAMTDTGTGITADNMNKIFQKKFTTKATGTGMGLGLVKVYIEKILNGKFNINSIEGEGTAAIIVLPIYEK